MSNGKVGRLEGCRRWQPRDSNISWEENRDSLIFFVKFEQGAGQNGDWKPLQTIAKRQVISHRKTSTGHRSSNAAKSKLCWQTPNQRVQTDIEDLSISQLNVKSFWGPSSHNFVSILMEDSLGFCENNFAFRFLSVRGLAIAVEFVWGLPSSVPSLPCQKNTRYSCHHKSIFKPRGSSPSLWLH